jgi:hypothetical protein
MKAMNAIRRRLIRAAIVFGVALLVVVLMLGMQPSAPQTFASPLSPPLHRWGIHLGNHVVAEPWDENLLRRIDGDKGGIWPDTIVFLSRNLYDVTRNTSGDCRITSIAGKYPSLTNTGVFTGYLQRASTAGVKIIIRIWPSPGNFITATHRINLSANPANGNRCDEGSDPSKPVANRSYDDIGTEIVKIHEWNAAHGIIETGFEPANEPNTEWYKGDPQPTLIQPSNPTAWIDMDAYFTNIYTYVHTFYPASQLRVFTPPMAQNNYAEMMRTGLDRCDPMTLYNNDFSGYEMMPNVFLYGYSNDGYTWHNYWALGFEDWVPNCDPNISPHGHHVDQWFPLSMREQMFFKINYMTEADLRSPGSPMYGNLANKGDQLGLTASNSISQFFGTDLAAQHIAAWNLNITNPYETEQSWHEAYGCNDFVWADPSKVKPPLERPWFTRWWLGETPSYSVAPCYKTYEPVILKQPTPTRTPCPDC